MPTNGRWGDVAHHHAIGFSPRSSNQTFARLNGFEPKKPRRADSGRQDGPGGDAQALYASIQRLLALPEATRLYLCHDYLAEGRSEHACMTTVAEQRAHNVHIHAGIDQDSFVAMRRARDATLKMPALILPSVQVNMRAGELPPAEANGVRYLKIPLDQL